jgi:hypothetical protein
MTELQAIAEVIKSVGATGQTMFIWYLIKCVVIATMKYSTIILLFICVKRIVIHVINAEFKVKEAMNETEVSDKS